MVKSRQVITVRNRSSGNNSGFSSTIPYPRESSSSDSKQTTGVSSTEGFKFNFSTASGGSTEGFKFDFGPASGGSTEGSKANLGGSRSRKLVLIGSAHVGKTAFVARLRTGEFRRWCECSMSSNELHSKYLARVLCYIQNEGSKPLIFSGLATTWLLLLCSFLKFGSLRKGEILKCLSPFALLRVSDLSLFPPCGLTKL